MNIKILKSLKAFDMVCIEAEVDGKVYLVYKDNQGPDFIQSTRMIDGKKFSLACDRRDIMLKVIEAFHEQK